MLLQFVFAQTNETWQSVSVNGGYLYYGNIEDRPHLQATTNPNQKP